MASFPARTAEPSGRVVVFDLGNVLIPWDRRRLYRNLIDDEAELDRFCDEVLTLTENARLDAGLPLTDLVADLCDRHPDDADLLMAFEQRWPETLGPAIAGSVALLERLVERGHRCLGLSNWGADTFAMVRDRYGFLELFEGLVISGHEGVTKPEPAIFEILCHRHGVDAASAVFIDDSQANVDTAASLGFDAIRFLDPDQLERALQVRKLLSPDSSLRQGRGGYGNATGR